MARREQHPTPTHRLAHGLRSSIRSNASAYAYSVTITGTFAAVQVTERPPEAPGVFAFVIGAGLAFAAVEAIASRGFRIRIRPDPTEEAED